MSTQQIFIDIAWFAICTQYDSDDALLTGNLPPIIPRLVTSAVAAATSVQNQASAQPNFSTPVLFSRVNWSYIARERVRGGKTAAQCRQRWLYKLGPHFKADLPTPPTKPVTSKSSKKKSADTGDLQKQQARWDLFLKIVQQNRSRNWMQISSEFSLQERKLLATSPVESASSSYSPFALLQVYVNYHLALKKSGRNWDVKEDFALRTAVKTLGTRQFNAVSALVGGGRTTYQCYSRWNKSLDPLIKSGKWTPSEDIRLLLALKSYASPTNMSRLEHNVNWAQLSQHVPGRTDVACRERYMRVLSNVMTSHFAAEIEATSDLLQVDTLADLSRDQSQSLAVDNRNNPFFTKDGNLSNVSQQVLVQLILQAVKDAGPGNWSVAATTIQNGETYRKMMSSSSSSELLQSLQSQTQSQSQSQSSSSSMSDNVLDDAHILATKSDEKEKKKSMKIPNIKCIDGKSIKAVWLRNASPEDLEAYNTKVKISKTQRGQKVPRLAK